MACIAAFAAAPGLARAGDDRIDRIVTGYMEREGVPGIAVVAMRGDRLVLSRSWGLADVPPPGGVRAVQPFYSVSKQMTAALMLKLAAADLVDLDAPVGDYLPAWFADEPELRVRHLLRHTSGIPDFMDLPDVAALEAAPAGTGSLAALLDIVAALPRRFAPGQRHAYSNTNYTALALIAERVSGRPFDVLQRTLLFAPLGLAGTDECGVLRDRGVTLADGHSDERTPASLPSNLQPSFTGNGGVCGSTEDLARWTRSLHAGRVVGPDRYRETAGPPAVAAGYEPPYGLGLSTLTLAGRPALSHGGVGDGWPAWAAYLPAEELTLVVLANRGWLWLTDPGVPIVRALLGDPDPAPLRRRLLEEAEMAALGGDFEDGLFEIRIEAERERVLVHVPAFGAPIALWKQDDGRFVSPERPDTFSLRLAGPVPEFDWAEHRSYLVRR